MEATPGASEEAEVLLPEVVAQSLASSTFVVLEASGRCVGVTHPDDLALVQTEIQRQVATGERPAGLWTALR
jgi:hypothetical protein